MIGIMDAITQKKPGNQTLSPPEIDSIVRHLEPHLRGGYSVRKACELAGIPKSTVYDLIERDSQFADKIDTSKQYLSELASSIVASELIAIKDKQSSGNELSKADRSFVQWFCGNHVSMRESFGQQVPKTYDPEIELRRMMAMIDAVSSQ